MQLLTPFVFSVLLSAYPAIDNEDEADLKAMQGRWQLVELGSVPPEDKLKEAKLTIKGVKMTLEDREFTLKLDAAKKPKAVDLTPLNGVFKDQTVQAIYSIDGDTLKLCVPNKPKLARPKEFKPDVDLIVLTLKRMK